MQAEQIIVRAMIDMAKENQVIGSVGDISRRIHEYKEKGEDISSITLQRTPFGFHSREAAEFVGRLLTAGIITQTDPIVVSENSLYWLGRISESWS